MSPQTQLTPQQAAILSAPAQNLLVSASAGSGKTFVLTQRLVKRILSGALDLDRVLIMTFTEKAAEQMRSRLEAALEAEIERLSNAAALAPVGPLRQQAQAALERVLEQKSRLPQAWISTIHAFCLRIIKAFLPELKGASGVIYAPQLQVLDEISQRLILRQSLESVLSRFYEQWPEPSAQALQAAVEQPEAHPEACFYALMDAMGAQRGGEALYEQLNHLLQKVRSLPQGLEQLKLSWARLGVESQHFGYEESLRTALTLYREALSGVASQRALAQKVLETPQTEGLLFYTAKTAKNSVENDKKCRYYLAILEALTAAEQVLEGLELSRILSGDAPEDRAIADQRKATWDALWQLQETLLEHLREIQGEQTFKPYAKPRRSEKAGEARQQFIEAYEALVPVIAPLFSGVVSQTAVEESPYPLLAAPAVVYERLTQQQRPRIYGLMTLLEALIHQYQKDKEALNALDFSDFEQLALTLLQKPEVATYYQQLFQEIYVDEYQDTSGIQEALIEALAQDNVFRVGDVKQSIYRFRQAKPALFQKRAKAYAQQDGGELFILPHNFRSAPEVLAGVNEVFTAWFQPQTTPDLVYQPDHLLHPKPGSNLTEAAHLEIHVIQDERTPVQKQDQAEKLKHDPLLREMRPGDWECLALIDHLLANHLNRPWHEIAILVRTNDACDRVKQWLERVGIPVRAKQAVAWYTNRAVVWLEQLLRLLDNSQQDYPLLAVLLSTLSEQTGWCEEALAQLRIWADQQADTPREALAYFHQVFEQFLHTPIEALEADLHPLWERAWAFKAWLDPLRERAQAQPLAQLVDRVWAVSPLKQLLERSPQGQADLEAVSSFCQFLERYEGQCLKGLRQFISYYDRFLSDPPTELVWHNPPEGVEVMTWHTAKGLEYPVVYLYELNRQWLRKSEARPVEWDETLGLIFDALDWQQAQKLNLPRRWRYQQDQLHQEVEEALRTLYVAMTRAEQTLYLFASESVSETPDQTRTPLTQAEKGRSLQSVWALGQKTGARKAAWTKADLEDLRTPVEPILMALGQRHPDVERAALEAGVTLVTEQRGQQGAATQGSWRLHWHKPLLEHGMNLDSVAPLLVQWIHSLQQQVLAGEAQRALQTDQSPDTTLESALPQDPSVKSDCSWRDQPPFRLNPREPALGREPQKTPKPAPIPSKITVSTLKRQRDQDSLEGGEDASVPLLAIPLQLKALDDFAAEDPHEPDRLALPQALKGAELGTFLHRLLYLLDWDPFFAAQTPEEEEHAYVQGIQNLQAARILSDEEGQWAMHNQRLMARFWQSDLFKQIRACKQAGGIYGRETPFTLCLGQSVEDGLIQGMIDLWYLTPEGLILVDYKSDALEGTSAQKREILWQRYGVQLACYGEALKRAFNRPVVKRILFLLREGIAYDFGPAQPLGTDGLKALANPQLKGLKSPS